MICSNTTFINRYGLKTLDNDELNIINIHELSSNEMKNNSVLTKGKELYKKYFVLVISLETIGCPLTLQEIWSP